ncbi:DUF1697 domain-containing protein [Candidatus Nitrososphaera gargensis]|uniref:DUF1697 domain-containing protein n=1 Tax=Candidatus Nitrososphaera gargensis TaxID=497727 RepID=UPI0011E5036A
MSSKADAYHQCLALLRGINMGGNNIIRMTDLVACFEQKVGFTNVTSYIQSGNILFRAADEQNRTRLMTNKIERVLSDNISLQFTSCLSSSRTNN